MQLENGLRFSGLLLWVVVLPNTKYALKLGSVPNFKPSRNGCSPTETSAQRTVRFIGDS